jgi:hypothetical protein
LCQQTSVTAQPQLIKKTISSCSASSEYNSPLYRGRFGCKNAFDGKVGPFDDLNTGDLDKGWATMGEGVGSFIQLNFAAPQSVSVLKYANRGEVEANKKVRVQFSDGSSTTVTLAKDNKLRVFALPLTTTTFVKITVLTVYTTINNGADEIELWGPPNGH